MRILLKSKMAVRSLPREPDYALRLGAERKFFVEAKKPAVAIVSNNVAAFQVRRYGWNARLPISVLSNFDQLVIYDCRVRPQAEDDARVARLKVYDYTEYVAKFDEIYALLSREAVYTGSFDAHFGIVAERPGAEPFDEYFLSQIETWRAQLAQDIARQNPTLTQAELNFLVQRLLNRVIFLRICEDRELERYHALQAVQTYDDLKALFRQADRRYNSGLFDFIEDQLSLNITVSSEVLIGIFQELYYPASPYAFSVVEAGILGEIYERFLGKQITVADQHVTIVDKDEVVASQGVVPTPKYVVDAIVEKTLAPLCAGRSPAELAGLRLVDIACGSGSFLVAAYEYLLNIYLEGYLQEGAEHHAGKVYEGTQNTWHLTLPERQRILCEHIFGVDIDPQAVEIARFSLLLKVLEDVPAAAIAAHWLTQHVRALPDLQDNIRCGNSLVDSAYFEYDEDALTDDRVLCRPQPHGLVTRLFLQCLRLVVLTPSSAILRISASRIWCVTRPAKCNTIRATLLPTLARRATTSISTASSLSGVWRCSNLPDGWATSCPTSSLASNRVRRSAAFCQKVNTLPRLFTLVYSKFSGNAARLTPAF